MDLSVWLNRQFTRGIPHSQITGMKHCYVSKKVVNHECQLQKQTICNIIQAVIADL